MIVKFNLKELEWLKKMNCDIEENADISPDFFQELISDTIIPELEGLNDEDRNTAEDIITKITAHKDW